MTIKVLSEMSLTSVTEISQDLSKPFLIGVPSVICHINPPLGRRYASQEQSGEDMRHMTSDVLAPIISLFCAILALSPPAPARTPQRPSRSAWRGSREAI